jgi:hypothetical protein
VLINAREDTFFYASSHLLYGLPSPNNDETVFVFQKQKLRILVNTVVRKLIVYVLKNAFHCSDKSQFGHDSLKEKKGDCAGKLVY